MINLEFHWLPVVVVAIGYWIFGGVWYAAIFAKRYDSALTDSGVPTENRQKSFGMALGAYLVAGLVLAFFLDNFARALNASSFSDGAVLGLYFWLAFVATQLLNHKMFEHRPSTIFGLNMGSSLISLVVMSGVLAIWN